MILDKIENAAMYKCLTERIAIGLDYVKNTDMSAMEPGKYEVAEGITAIISEYNTKELTDARLEAHEKFIDIQYIISGEEFIGYAPLNGQTPTIPYDAERDVVFYNEEVSFTKLETGMFAIYFPTDLHQPCVKIEDTAPVKKCVVKLLA